MEVYYVPGWLVVGAFAVSAASAFMNSMAFLAALKQPGNDRGEMFFFKLFAIVYGAAAVASATLAATIAVLPVEWR